VRVGYAAAGAAVGAVVRWVAAAVWPSTVWDFVSTLVVAGAAAGALGFLQPADRESGPAVFLWSATGTAASLGIAATFAVAQQSLWCAVYLILFPVCVVIGFSAGLIVRSVIPRPAVPGQRAGR
jgi:fluoride ion exporter CrcB/FEX